MPSSGTPIRGSAGGDRSIFLTLYYTSRYVYARPFAGLLEAAATSDATL